MRADKKMKGVAKRNSIESLGIGNTITPPATPLSPAIHEV
jgi:hypothetical protein